MGVLTELIDGIVRITEAGGEAVGERIRGLVILGVVALVLVFLLILFFIEPLTATILSVLVILASIFVVRSDSDLI